MKKLYVLFFLLPTISLIAQKKRIVDPREALKAQTAASIQAGYERYKSAELRIWNLAEVGFKEKGSTVVLQDLLRENGFTLEAGVAGMPTAFVATYGSGSPVIGILAEFDALPGLSQDSAAVKTPVPTLSAGHGCGHHLFGAGSVAAAVAIKELLASGKIRGTVKLFGSPAEEGGGGKVYMVREGLFKDVDIAISWHPSAFTGVNDAMSLANTRIDFTFHGRASHAAAAPHLGRSALDAVELDRGQLQVVTRRHPTLGELTDLLFAWRAVRHVRSNAIVLARNGATVGIGAGLTSGGTFPEHSSPRMKPPYVPSSTAGANLPL
mgnify:CR=1 FL=1